MFLNSSAGSPHFLRSLLRAEKGGQKEGSFFPEDRPYKYPTESITMQFFNLNKFIAFIFLLCFAFSSVVEAKRPSSSRHASRSISEVKKRIIRTPLRKQREAIAPRKRPQRSITARQQSRVSPVNKRQSRTIALNKRHTKGTAFNHQTQPTLPIPSHLPSTPPVSIIPQVPNTPPISFTPSASIDSPPPYITPPALPVLPPVSIPVSAPTTYFSQLKPHTQKNIQLGGLDTLYTKHLKGQGQTIAVVEQSGTWTKLREAILNPQNTFTKERRKNYKNNFLPAVGDPAMRLHPEEKNDWIRQTDKNEDHGANVASVVLDLAPQAKVLPVSTSFDLLQSSEVYDVADAIMDLSQREDVNIINISAGNIRSTEIQKDGYSESGALVYLYKTIYTSKFAEAFKAIAKAGKVVVLATGNGGREIQPPEFDQGSEMPRSQIMGHLVEALDLETLKSVIFAGNLDLNTNTLRKSSNKPGNWAEAQERFLCAPGEHALPDRDQHVYGTSFSSPYICAAIANLCSKPGVTPKRAVQALLETADQRPEKEIYGRGIIRADRALEWLEQGN